MVDVMSGDVGVQVLQALQDIRTEMARMNSQLQVLSVRTDRLEHWMERFATELVQLRTEFVQLRTGVTTEFNQFRAEMLQLRTELQEVRAQVR